MLAPYRGAARRLGNRIRRRLLYVFLAFGIGAASTWYYKEAVFLFLLEPAGGNLSPFGGMPVFNSPTAMMGATIQLAMRGGAAAAFPVLLISIYTLIKPLIAPMHRRFLVIFIPSTIVSFLIGAAFAYYVMLPTGLNFLLNFGTGIAVPMIVISEYMDLLTAMMFWLGVVFELPIVMYLLARMRIVSYPQLKGFRKYVPVTAFILSAILTPTFDVINQTLLAVPIILLYEVGLFLSWIAWPEEGNYLWFKTIGSVASKIYRGIKTGVAFPVVKTRSLYRKVRRK